MTTIGYATLQIIPSLKNVSAEINKQLAAERDMGKDAGRLLGANIATGALASGPGKRIGKELEAGVAQGAEGAAGQVKSRLSERLGAQVGSVVGKGIGGGISAGIKIGELALKGSLVGAAGVAAVALGGVGLALTKGFDRLKSIDQAKFKLQALGHDAADVAKIMDSALASVKGTAFGLDEAANTAASAVAAGVKPGQDLTKYLSTVGDAAAIAGTSLSDMGDTFNNVSTLNAAFNDSLQIFAQRGIPVYDYLSKKLKVSTADVKQLASEGKISSQVFREAIEENISGAALKMGQSFEGSVQNAQAALARLGAAFLAPIFGNAAGGIGSITDGLDNLTKWVTAHQPEIIGFFTTMGVAAVSTAQDLVKSFGDMAKGAGDFAHGLGTVVSLFDTQKGQDLKNVGDDLNGIGDKLISTAGGFDAAKDKIRAWGDAARQAAENAQGAQGPVTGLGTALGALPFKKVIGVEVQTGDSDSKIHGIGNAIDALPFKKTVNIEIHGTATGTAVAAPLLNDPDHPLIGPQNNGPVLTPNQNGIPTLHKALGGLLSGPGTGTSDSILMWGSTGEFMVNADATRKNLALLEIINSGKLPGFAGGGMVGSDVTAAENLVGTPYSMAKRFDCSGDVARVINAALGLPGGDLMTTASASQWLSARGFKPGLGGPGSISVGWKNGGPGGGHMAMTLSDGRNAEGGGSHPNFLIGAGAAGASSSQFTDHMHLALAAASAVKGAGNDATGTGQGDDSAAPTAGSSSGGAGALPDSFSGLAGFGLSGLGAGVGTTKSGSDLSLFGNAAASAVSGQVDSALGVLGINGSPGWLKAATQLVGGLKVGGHDRSANGQLSGVSDGSLFNGANPLGGFGQGSAAPLSATSTATGTPPPDDAHGTRAGQQPGPQTIYNIRTATVDDAFLAAQRKQDERYAAKLSRY